MEEQKLETVRDLLNQLFPDDEVTLETPLFGVSQNAVKDEYIDDYDRPQLSYDPGSWRSLKRVLTDTRDDGQDTPVVLIVLEDEPAPIPMDDTEESTDG